MIEGIKEVVLSIVFRCPPGLPPEAIQQQIAMGGVTVAVGLLPHARHAESNIRDVVQQELKLS